MSNIGEFSWSWILGHLTHVQREKLKLFVICLHPPQNVYNKISIMWWLYGNHVLPIKPFTFLMFSLAPPSLPRRQQERERPKYKKKWVYISTKGNKLCTVQNNFWFISQFAITTRLRRKLPIYTNEGAFLFLFLIQLQESSPTFVKVRELV